MLRPKKLSLYQKLDLCDYDHCHEVHCQHSFLNIFNSLWPMPMINNKWLQRSWNKKGMKTVFIFMIFSIAGPWSNHLSSAIELFLFHMLVKPAAGLFLFELHPPTIWWNNVSVLQIETSKIFTRLPTIPKWHLFENIVIQSSIKYSKSQFHSSSTKSSSNNSSFVGSTIVFTTSIAWRDAEKHTYKQKNWHWISKLLF